MAQDSYQVVLQFKEEGTFSYNDDYYWYGEEDEEETPQLINRLRAQYPVRIYKYGYQATDEVLEALAEALIQTPTTYLRAMEELPGKTALTGITLYLEKYNEEAGKWEAYEFDVGESAGQTAGVIKIEDGSGGVYTFESGLHRAGIAFPKLISDAMPAATTICMTAAAVSTRNLQ